MIARPWECDAAKRSYSAREAWTCLEVASLPAHMADKQAALGLPRPRAVVLHPHAIIEPAGTRFGRLRATLDRLQRIAQCLHLSFERQARLAFLAQNLAPAVAVDADRDNHRD